MFLKELTNGMEKWGPSSLTSGKLAPVQSPIAANSGLNRSSGQSQPLPQSSFEVGTPHTNHPPPTSNDNVMWAMVNALKQQTDSVSRMRRPPDLPTFSGDAEDWHRFIANFEETTQKRNRTNLDKFERLQKALKGKALDTVR